MKANKLIALFVTSASLVSCSFGQLNSVTSTLSSATTNTSTTNPLSSPTSSNDSSTDSTPTSKPDTSSPTSSTDSTPNTSSPDSTPNTSSPDSTPNTSSPDSTPNTSSPDSTPNSTTPAASTPATPSINPNESVWVDSVSYPSNYSTYIANKSEQTTANKQTEFKDRTKAYQVGDDNSFNIKPIVKFSDFPEFNNHDFPEPANWQYSLTLERHNGSSYETVTNTTTYIQDFDTHTCDIDFTQAAIGQRLRVTIGPELSNTQKTYPEIVLSDYVISMEFEVVDGYNVYDVIDLSYMNNDPAIRQVWIDYRAEKNKEELAVAPSNYILHTNLSIDNTNIPSYYFYQKGDDIVEEHPGVEGSFKDFETKDPNTRIGSIFMHQFDNSTTEESVNVIGNYFTLSIENLPLIEYDWDKNVAGTANRVISHNQIFFMSSLGGTNGDVQDKKTFSLQDMKLLGNSPKVEDISAGGGLISSKSYVKTLIRNTIQRSFFVSFFNEGTSAEYLIQDCKAYDSFNCFVYNYGGPNTKIVNSEMIGAGGPVIIQDHAFLTETDPGKPGSTVVDDQSVLESYVSGTEGWFTTFAAGSNTIVGQIKAMDDLFKPFGRTFLRRTSGIDFFNFVAINKDGAAAGATTNWNVRGRIQIGDNNFDYGKYDGTSNANLGTFIDAVNAITGGEAPFFYTSGNGMAYYAGADSGYGLLDSSGPISSADHQIFKGDYLNLYFTGMSIVFGYGPYTA